MARGRSGANGLSVVQRSEVVRISEVVTYGDSAWCHGLCPLYGGCPYLGVSVNRGFTVCYLKTVLLRPRLRLYSSNYSKCL